jgi:hypothetical protein
MNNESDEQAEQHPKGLPRFDLTTTAGAATTLAFFVAGGASTSVISPLAVIGVPLTLLAMRFKRRPTMVNSAPPIVTPQPKQAVQAPTQVQQQQEAIIAVLKAGREQGLEELEMEIESTAGVNLEARLPKALGVQLQFKAGSGAKTTIRAKYRPDA